MKKKSILAKIKAEPDQFRRVMMMVQYIIDHGSVEDKNRTEDILNAALKV